MLISAFLKTEFLCLIHRIHDIFFVIVTIVDSNTYDFILYFAEFLRLSFYANIRLYM